MLLLSALLAGIGVGLFIDEVGKFITETNDYFFAPAAPLIYGALLLLVALWLVVRRAPAESTSDAMQAAVDATRDGLDGRLSAMERDRVVASLGPARSAGDPAVAALAERQASLLLSPAMESLLVRPGWVARGDARALLERVLPSRLERALVVAGLLWTAFLAAVAGLLLLAIVWVGDPIQLPVTDGPIEFPSDPLWAILSLVIGVVVGVASGVATVLVLRHRERTGIRVATAAILLNLVVGGLLTFYVSQFGAVASTLGHVALLALILDYGGRLARHEPVDLDRPVS
jgi:GNAT superfamily N-acetyltransferase